jgi:hypothetical protein
MATIRAFISSLMISGPAVRPTTDVARTDLEAVIMDMLEAQYGSPVRVVGFNTNEGWS